MKKIIPLLISVFIFQIVFSQSKPEEEPTTKSKDRIKIYVIPAFSFNIGKQVVPFFYDPVDCNCQFYFYDLKETGSFGYNIGMDAEGMISKRTSFSIGFNLEAFRYYGEARHLRAYSMGGPTSLAYSVTQEYKYKDTYLTIPILVNYSVIKNSSKEIKIALGGSGGLFIGEKNSIAPVQSYQDNEYKWRNEHSPLTAFGIGAIDYFSGEKILINIGFRITAQINPTPYLRRFVSGGIKLGVVLLGRKS